MTYYCYFLTTFPKDKMKTYIGITNDLEKRILQHNKVLKGGAKCTKMYSNWNYCLVLENFKSKGDAQSFESLWKNQNNKKHGVGYKLANLFDMLNETRWKDVRIKFDY